MGSTVEICTRRGSHGTMNLATSSTRWTVATIITLPSATSIPPRTTMKISATCPLPGKLFVESQMHDIEFILNAGYKTLIYDGNFDIICNHSGVLDMIADMQWDGKADYDKAVREAYHYGR